MGGWVGGREGRYKWVSYIAGSDLRITLYRVNNGVPHCFTSGSLCIGSRRRSLRMTTRWFRSTSTGRSSSRATSATCASMPSSRRATR